MRWTSISVIAISLTIFIIFTVKGEELIKVTNPIGHGEGPHWSESEQALYWVDITQRDVWKLHQKSGNVTTCHIREGDVTVIVPIKDEKNEFIVGVGDKLKRLIWNGKNDTVPILKDFVKIIVPKGGRLNDGKVDSEGRLWVGTIGHEENNMVDKNVAALFKIACHNDTIQAILQISNVSVSNGIAWSGDGYIMYYVDSPTKNIDAFDFDPVNGTIDNRRTVFSLEEHNITGVPDGMTIDVDDKLWIAIFGGSAVIEIQPHLGRLVKVHPVPGVPQVSSVIWGGPRLDILYITTSSRGSDSGGELYALIETGARGRPANEFIMPECIL